MIQLITEPWYGEFSHTLFAIHQLRHRVFKVRMDWDVQISGDMEVDKFDSLHPAYLAQLSDDGRVQGCVRLLPTKGPTMLRDTSGCAGENERNHQFRKISSLKTGVTFG